MAWGSSVFAVDQFSEAVISPARANSRLTQVFVRRRATDGARCGFHWNDGQGGRWAAGVYFYGLASPELPQVTGRIVVR